uniref:Uncharacterized protein n=1 Tax=Anguilla anguilla TaxID=7936 RepID=A0A0E9U4U0_ANGAN
MATAATCPSNLRNIHSALGKVRWLGGICVWWPCLHKHFIIVTD